MTFTDHWQPRHDPIVGPVSSRSKRLQINTTRSLPHLLGQNRVALADYLNREDVQVALAELTAACACIAGAIFCTCEARLTLTEQQQELVEPLALAYAAGVQLTAS